MTGTRFTPEPGGLAARLRRNHRPIRFVLAGVVNTLFGLALYPALLWSSAWLHRHYMVSLGLAQGISLLFAFANYKLAVFRTRANILREFGTFSSFYLANYAANWLALPVMVEIIGIPPVIAQWGFSAVLMVGSYFWHSRLTFKAKRDS